MCKQMSLLSRNTFEPMAGSSAMALETLMFSGQPQYKFAINLSKCRIERGFIERPIVIYPPSDFCVEHMRQIQQRLVAAILQIPAPDFLTYCFPRLGTDRRAEVDEGLAPSVLRQPRPKSIAKEIKAYGSSGIRPPLSR